ncbi:MAG: DUF4325 domain-containing protein [Candidatus Peribacteraceae bacterium]
MSKRIDIGDFILANLETHTADIVTYTAHQFGISRQRIHQYLLGLIAEGKIIKTGKTSDTRYFLTTGKILEFEEKITKDLAEDKIWTQFVRPMLIRYPDNIYKICQYGFTEIYNNAIDHSEGSIIFSRIEAEPNEIKITIMDNGIGIFEKIQRALNLSSPREAILHLSKGKFTTDRSKHTGEGIFFTSRICDSFSILSSDMYYTFRNNDWFLSDQRREDFGNGTFIKMRISLPSEKTVKGVMDRYSDSEIGFGKTIVAVRLSADADDPHISRSQAKRLLIGLDRFQHVVLDFNRVEEVGQAFIDEIFRVFQNEYPNMRIDYVNARPDVQSMIDRVKATK